MTDNKLFGNSEQLNDTISRHVAIKAADSIIERDTSGNNDVVKAMTAWKEYIKALPSAQPDVIPLEWIDKHLEWLDNCDNDFAQLAKVSIKAMVELWKKDRI